MTTTEPSVLSQPKSEAPEPVDSKSPSQVARGSFSHRLRVARVASGMSVRDVCRVIGAGQLTPAAVYLLETGKRRHPTTITVERLAKALIGQEKWKETAAWLAFGLGSPPLDDIVQKPTTANPTTTGSDDESRRLVVNFYTSRVQRGELAFQLADLLGFAADNGGHPTTIDAVRALRAARAAGVLNYKIRSRADSAYEFVAPVLLVQKTKKTKRLPAT